MQNKPLANTKTSHTQELINQNCQSNSTKHKLAMKQNNFRKLQTFRKKQVIGNVPPTYGNFFPFVVTIFKPIGSNHLNDTRSCKTPCLLFLAEKKINWKNVKIQLEKTVLRTTKPTLDLRVELKQEMNRIKFFYIKQLKTLNCRPLANQRTKWWKKKTRRLIMAF